MHVKSRNIPVFKVTDGTPQTGMPVSTLLISRAVDQATCATFLRKAVSTRMEYVSRVGRSPIALQCNECVCCQTSLLAIDPVDRTPLAFFASPGKISDNLARGGHIARFRVHVRQKVALLAHTALDGHSECTCLCDRIREVCQAVQAVDESSVRLVLADGTSRACCYVVGN